MGGGPARKGRDRFSIAERGRKKRSCGSGVAQAAFREDPQKKDLLDSFLLL